MIVARHRTTQSLSVAKVIFVALAGSRFRPTKVGHGPSAITLVMRVAYHFT